MESPSIAKKKRCAIWRVCRLGFFIDSEIRVPSSPPAARERGAAASRGRRIPRQVGWQGGENGHGREGQRYHVGVAATPGGVAVGKWQGGILEMVLAIWLKLHLMSNLCYRSTYVVFV